MLRLLENSGNNQANQKSSKNCYRISLVTFARDGVELGVLDPLVVDVPLSPIG